MVKVENPFWYPRVEVAKLQEKSELDKEEKKRIKELEKEYGVPFEQLDVELANKYREHWESLIGERKEKVKEILFIQKKIKERGKSDYKSYKELRELLYMLVGRSKKGKIIEEGLVNQLRRESRNMKDQIQKVKRKIKK